MTKTRFLSIAFLFLLATAASASDDDMVIGPRNESGKTLNYSTPSRGGTPAVADSSALMSLMRISGLFLVVLGCCVGGTVLYLKRRAKSGTALKQSPRLSIQERLSFGPNREFILLKACDRVLVIASQNGQAVLLTDMASEEPPQAVPETKELEEPLTYESVLNRATRRLNTSAPKVPTATQTQSWPELEGVLR